MDVFESHGRLFEITLASDVVNDGMSLELTDLSDASGPAPILTAFWHDDESGFDFHSHGAAALPFDVVERFVREARLRLSVPQS